MAIKILLIEDNPHKRDRILSFLDGSDINVNVQHAGSFTSGYRLMTSDEPFDLILMDMSLPTYDKSSSESGGRFRTLGGREVARKAYRKGVTTPVLFVTQYNAFSEGDVSHTLDTLDAELRTEFGDKYRGIVQYDSSQSMWKQKISDVLCFIDKSLEL